MTANESESHVRLDEYVAGVLTPEERLAVEEHIYECDECRAELDATRRMHVQVHSALDAEAGPSARVRRDVFAQIASTARSVGPAVQQASEPSYVVRPSRWSRAPSLPRWVQVAAIVLVLLQAALLIRPLTERAATPEQVMPRGLSQVPTQLRVVFAPTATEAQIRDVLGVLGARIVDGPSATGAYRIELQGTDPKAVAAAIAAARSRQDVLQSIDAAP